MMFSSHMCILSELCEPYGADRHVGAYISFNAGCIIATVTLEKEIGRSVDP